MGNHVRWNKEQVIRAVRERLVRNGAAVGEVVEADATRRLNAIAEPTWGRGYRRNVLARLMTSEVVVEGGDVVVRVGLKATVRSRHHGYFIELGSRTAPAQPFLRPAMLQNGRVIVRVLEGG